MAKDFGELALVLGDAHVPGRAPKIPAKLKRMLVPNKMQHVLCTGNMGSRELYEDCLLYTSPSPRDRQKARMPSSA